MPEAARGRMDPLAADGAPPRAILVISLRYLGDLLLTTPLVRSLRRAYPASSIGLLVMPGMEAVLEGNPDIDEVLSLPVASVTGGFASAVELLWRRFDLAVVAETADRPHVYGWLAAGRRAGLLPPRWSQRWWKQLLLDRAVVSPPDAARPQTYERLAHLLGIAWEPAVVAPTAGTRAHAWSGLLGFDATREPFAAIHLSPRFRYKRWHAEGWRDLIGCLVADGLRVVVVGGPEEAERRYADEVLGGCRAAVSDLVGRLRLAQTADLLRLCAVYVGPDTASTHLAAACGAPTVALFGPTDPRLWGPLAQGGGAAPYQRVLPIQDRGNVTLLQEASLPCVPCQAEGCDRHRESRSRCLETMSAARVIAAVRARLRNPPT